MKGLAGNEGRDISDRGANKMIPSGKEILFLVVRGFGLFLTVTGMIGMTFILGPLNLIMQDLEFTVVFGSKLYAFLILFGFCVFGGALDFLSNLGIKSIEK